MAAISDTGRNLPSPWSHVLRGGNDLEAAANATPSSPSAAAIPLDAISPRRSPPSPEAIQILDGGDAAKAKKPAWNVPANGVVEVSPVMGASWPALTRASPKTSSDSLKTPGDGSVTAPASASQVQGSCNRGFMRFFFLFCFCYVLGRIISVLCLF